MAFKKKLSSSFVLHIHNPKADIELHTDVSSLETITYFSKSTSKAEKQYHSYKLKMLAIVKAVERFQVYLHGINFKIVTDCNSLVLAFKKST